MLPRTAARLRRIKNRASGYPRGAAGIDWLFVGGWGLHPVDQSTMFSPALISDFLQKVTYHLLQLPRKITMTSAGFAGPGTYPGGPGHGCTRGPVSQKADKHAWSFDGRCLHLKAATATVEATTRQPTGY